MLDDAWLPPIIWSCLSYFFQKKSYVLCPLTINILISINTYPSFFNLLLIRVENEKICGFFSSKKQPKARDQKQIYRLNETKSHWGLNPSPPARMRNL